MDRWRDQPPAGIQAFLPSGDSQFERAVIDNEGETLLNGNT
jgi:hypothetical protein